MIVDESNFEQVVSAYYASLYRFAFSLARREADACDLTQETFRRLAEKGHQVRDPSKIKTWLFTTLYREFVDGWQKQSRCIHVDPDAVDHELPPEAPALADRIDGAAARNELLEIEEPYRAPLVLFYLEDHSYREIAEILSIPAGTVMSRISRGRDLLRQRMEDKPVRVNGHAVANKRFKTQVVP